MAQVTRAARDRARADAAWQTMGPCGLHSICRYFEYRSSWEMNDGAMVELPDPRYRPGLYRCEDCGTEMDHTA